MRGHGSVDGTGRALDPLDGLLGALADAGAAAVALGIVDDSDIILQENRLIRAVAHAEAAGNATDLAGLVDQRTLVLVGALDQKTGHEVLELLKEINKSGKTVIIVTHDEGIAKMTDRIITISDGRIVGDSKER